MAIELESMAVEMPEVKGHPNRVAFRGVLTVIDVPSEKAPFGSKGKRVLLTRKAAEKAIPSLLGMAVDYAPSLDRHDMQRKVGIITKAELVGRNLEVGGYLFGKDFPEIVEEIGRLGRGHWVSGERSEIPTGEILGGRSEGSSLRAKLMTAVHEIRGMIQSAQGKCSRPEKTSARRAEAGLEAGAAGGELGMSFEVTKVNVLNQEARIWTLIDVTFTGAAILRKDKAAYRDTWIELA